MDFTGYLNYANYEANAKPLRVAAAIRDARLEYGVVPEARDATDDLLDGVGFMLVDAPSTVTDWADKDEVARVYYDEAQATVQALLPSFELGRLQSHTFRNEDIEEHCWVDGIQYGPCAEFVHNDYADFLTPDGQNVEKSFAEVMGMPTDRRVVGVNVWRSVTDEPLARFPLAVCDRTSIAHDDLRYDLNPNAPKPFNAHYCVPSDAHRWHYYSGMTRDEALVFTTYDSKPDDGGLFRPTLHTAVQIPGSEGRTPRVSVEVRLFAYR